ncbi:MAG: rhodanese-like domain-containing protein [Planctomycetota bacterium]
MQTIEVGDLAEKKQQGDVDLVDVRMPTEFREVHAVGARNLPLDTLNASEVAEARNGASKPLYVICKSGGRSTMAVKKFLDAGYDNVVNVEGGTQAWVQAGLPVVRGKKSISLERQVRILAGFLAFLGAALGYFVHPYFIGLSAFIGAGLMFAGITDTCGMGMMLAKMPWNQVDSGEQTAGHCAT